jgi:hypothetical protein
MARIFQISIILCLFNMMDVNSNAQPENIPSSGNLALVNRMDSTKVKFIRSDKPIKVRMLDGRRLEGRWYLLDELTMVIGEQAIPMKDIYILAGYMASTSKGKTMGAGLIVLSALAATYPAYLIFSGFALGQPHAVFVGATVIFLDLFLAYAGATLMGIYPRRFNRLNWDIRIDYPMDSVYMLPGELHLIPPD